MKLITRDTDYAMRALCVIARKNKKIVPVSQILDELGIPRPFLRKILQSLQKASVLFSYKGKGGGFTLAKPADKILLLEVMRIFQGRLSLNECSLNKKTCPEVAHCPLREKITTVEKGVFLQLRGVTVASLLNHKG